MHKGLFKEIMYENFCNTSEGFAGILKSICVFHQSKVLER